MSLVGPRPHALGSTAGNELFWRVDRQYWHRHALKPGITGLAQLRGFRGATNTKRDIVNRMGADLEYQHGWSLLRDVSILVRPRSEERSVGKECVRPGSSRWSRYHKKQTQQNN